MDVGVEAQEGSSCLGNRTFPLPAYHCGRLRGEASIIIKGVQATANSVRSFLAPASGSGSGLAFGVYGKTKGGMRPTRGDDHVVQHP